MRSPWILALAALAAPLARAERFEQDDPRGRIEAMKLLEGIRTPEQMQQIVRDGDAEAAKYGLRPTGGIVKSAATAPTALSWVNLGPATADFEVNGDVYTKVDSGRARKIIVDPRNANVVYFATSGGGVWKTYDALATVTSTTGPHWQPITDTLMGTMAVGTLALNPAAPDSLLLGLGDPFDVHVSPSIRHSDDGGVTWSDAVTLTAQYSGFLAATATSVRDIAFEPTSGATVFAATDAGLFRSQEGGVGTNWVLMTPAGASSPLDCWSVTWAGAQTFVAACIDATASSSGGAIYYTDDAGASWHTSSLADSNVRRITLAAGKVALNGGGWRVYALAANGNNDDQEDVFISSDAGHSFTSLNMVPGGRAPSNPTASGADVDQNDLDFMHGQAFYNHMIVVDDQNPDIVFIGGNLCMGRSEDAGTTWDLLTDWLPLTGRFSGWGANQYAHADWHAATVAHIGGVAYFYGGNDGGLIRSIDNGSSGFITSAGNGAVWEDKLNRGIVSHLVYSVATGNERAPTANCAQGSTANDIVYGGFQDNGTRIRVQPGGTTPYTGFNQIKGGDGFGVGLGCNTSGGGIGSNLIATYASEASYADDGLSAQPTFTATIPNNMTPSITLHPYYTFVMRIASDLKDANGQTYVTPITSSAGAGYVYRSTDGGHSWSSINGTIHRQNGTTPAQFPRPMINIGVHPGVAGAYIATSLTCVYVTVDGGANWHEAGPFGGGTATTCAPASTLTYLPIHHAAFDSADAAGNTIWVVSKSASMSDGSNDTAGHLFKCTNVMTAASCVASGSGIPSSIPINVVKVDPNDHNTIYVGTEIGLYRSIDGGTSFSRYGNNLPLVSVTDVAVAYDGSSIRIATYGRGFWEIYPKAGGSPAGVAGNGDFDASQTIDGLDLVREAGQLLQDNTSDSYNGIGNLVGTTNSIDASDFSALVAKLGGRP